MKKTFNKFIPLSLPLITTPFITTQYINNQIINTKNNYTINKHAFINTIQYYEHINKKNINTYYFNNNKIPYISIKQTLSTLNNIINTNLIQIKTPYNFLHKQNYQIYKTNNTTLKFN